MRQTIIKTLTMVALLLIGIATFAVPASKVPVTIRQANGKYLTFIIKGDERVNWATTLDGYTILRCADKMFYYATKDAKGNLVASSIVANNQAERDAKEVEFVTSLQKDLRYSAEQIKKLKEKFAPVTKYNTKIQQSPFPTSGTDSLLVILVEFSDRSFTFTRDNFDSMCNQSNYMGNGSIKDYFLTNSDSNFNLAIKVVGPYTLPNNMAYYGNTETHPMGSYYFVRDAVNKAAADGVNFANFDNDNDGYVDDICVIFSGTPQSSTGVEDEIWPHSGQMSWYGGNMPYKNGKYINRYSCSAEKRNYSQMDNIGTFCHEFGHVLGLPDEYDTDYGESGGTSVCTGEWSVMCEGSYNNDGKSPALWSAAQKVMTGWLSLDTLATPQDSLILHPITGHNDKAYRINLDEDNFVVIEQRKQQGFDAHIPGNGMLIYRGQMSKINAWINSHSNTINVNPNDRGWYLEIANGNNINSPNAAFPGSGSKNYFIETGNNLAITSIDVVNDNTIRFNYNSAIPTVQSKPITGTNTMSSFASTGNIVYNGGSSITSKGIIYSLDADCPNDNVSTFVYDTVSTDTTAISVTVTGLQRGTQYYYRAFAINQTGNIGLGDIRSTTTQTGLGFVVTQSATNVSQNSAKLNGNYIYAGEGDYIEKGFVYTSNDTINPSLEDSNSISISVEGNTTGIYSVNISGLQAANTYYFRTYMTNSYGTYYGSKLSFTTTFPAISNNTISSNQAFCLGTTPEQLTGSEATGAFGNFTYLWQQKNRGDFSWSDAEGTNNLKDYQPAAITDSTYFRRIAISDNSLTAKDTSNEVLLDVLISRGGYIKTSNNTYTQGATTNMILKQYRGTVVDWEKSNDTISWTSLNDNDISHQETFTDTGANYYRVKVQIEQCPAAYSTIKNIFVTSNSITDIEFNNNITLMPNPCSNGTFTIKSDIENAQSLIITNTLGQIVYSEKDVNLNDKQINLDVQSGAYIINIIANDKVMTKKLIINK